jgi:hypothetical protein
VARRDGVRRGNGGGLGRFGTERRLEGTGGHRAGTGLPFPGSYATAVGRCSFTSYHAL